MNKEVLYHKINMATKTWIFISPENITYNIVGGFAKFCKENNLSINKMRDIAHFRSTEKFYNGWTVWVKEGYYEDGLWIKKR